MFEIRTDMIYKWWFRDMLLVKDDMGLLAYNYNHQYHNITIYFNYNDWWSELFFTTCDCVMLVFQPFNESLDISHTYFMKRKEMIRNKNP